MGRWQPSTTRSNYLSNAALCAVTLVEGRPTLESLLAENPPLGSPFDVIYFVGLVGMLAATAWAAYRLAIVWWHAADALTATATGRLRAACARIVERHGISVDTGLWSPVGTSTLAPAIAASCRRLQTASGAVPELSSVREFLAAGAVGTERRRTELVALLREELPAACEADDALAQDPAKDSDASKRRLAIEAANDVLALELVVWVRWVLRHVRTLAFFLVLSLVVLTLLLYSYPFRPQELIRLGFLAVCVVVVVSLSTVVLGMGRNPTLNVLAGKPEGQMSWDRSLLVNLVTFVVLPALATVTSQLPALAGSLLSWVEPVILAIGQR
jgi:hypothetical protein